MKWWATAGNRRLLAPEAPIEKKAEGVVMDCPDYKGFAWDHPLMIKWRETHPVHPGLVWSRGSGVRIFGLSVAALVIVPSSYFNPRTQGWGWLFLVLGLVGLGGLLENEFWNFRLKSLAEPEKFDELVSNIQKLFRAHGQDFELPNFNLWRLNGLPAAEAVLIERAKTVLLIEADFPEEEGRRHAPGLRKVRGDFEWAYEVLESVGLVKNSYGPYYQQAQKSLDAERARADQAPSA